jgi:hypothetical protein
MNRTDDSDIDAMEEGMNRELAELKFTSEEDALFERMWQDYNRHMAEDKPWRHWRHEELADVDRWNRYNRWTVVKKVLPVDIAILRGEI